VILYCGECGKPAGEEKTDLGIGPYEFWGQKCVDTQIAWVSDCCEGSLFENPELTVEHEHEEEWDWREDKEPRENDSL
jgi:hypothetical protein